MKAPIIHEINGYIQSIYLVEEENGLFLLDGCSRVDVEVVDSFIRNKLNKSMNELKLVISTHDHPDHAGGLEGFKDKGIPIAGPVGLGDSYKGFVGFFVYFIDILLTYLVAINKKKKIKNIFFKRHIVLDFELSEGDKVPGFEDWQILECPGHTGIDLSIYNKQINLAYVADNFVGNARNVYRPYPISFPQKYRESLQKYLDMNVQEFLIAHYGRIKIPHERIQKLIETTPQKPRIHRNTLVAIFLKLIKALLR